MEITTQGSAQSIYSKLKSKFEEIQAQGKFEQIKEIRYDDAACKAIASGPGFKADIQCKDGKVLVALDLNFLLKPLRGKIEEKIAQMVSRI